MIFRLNIRICFKSGAKIPLFCRNSGATALKFVANQGQEGTIYLASAISTDLLQPDKPAHSRSFGNQGY